MNDVASDIPTLIELDEEIKRRLNQMRDWGYEGMMDGIRKELETINSLCWDTVLPAVTKRDQAQALLIANLLATTAWSTEGIADIVGKKHAWVLRRARFGRYLKMASFIPEEGIGTLTEREFRMLWKAAKIKFLHTHEDARLRDLLSVAIRASEHSPDDPSIPIDG